MSRPDVEIADAVREDEHDAIYEQVFYIRPYEIGNKFSYPSRHLSLYRLEMTVLHALNARTRYLLQHTGADHHSRRHDGFVHQISNNASSLGRNIYNEQEHIVDMCRSLCNP